ncbi:hypothetical protein ACFV3R_32840 [Streptomyces sp. NPDC059740]|uniref:hypothetical protein n=1 Tax=Streptomyces sp. NPDC059740 TaxID=3346926 RepID=UPI00365C1657
MHGNSTAAPPPAPAAEAPLTSAGVGTPAEETESREQGTEAYWAGHVSQRVVTNRGVVIGTLIEQGIRRLRGTALTGEDVAAHLRTYVRSQDDDLAINKILTDGSVVVLTGADGSGRFSTALDVLHRRMGNTTIRQVRREADTPFALSGLREHNTGWILDLRAETPPAGFGRELAEDANELPPGSLLIVLIGTQAWLECGKGATGLSRPLAGPPRADILRKHLAGVPLIVSIDKWIAAEPIRRGIGQLPPFQIQAWADAIVNTEEVERDKGLLTPARVAADESYFDTLVENVVKAAQDWRSDLLEWHTTHQDSDYRNYLLAAAVLEGASSQQIYEASTTLAQALGETPTLRTGQQGLGVVALTHRAKADLQPDGTIRFRYHNYAEAVIDYFLDDRPHLAEEFTRWTAAQATGIDDGLAAPLAWRVSQWAVHTMARHRRTRLLKTLAEQWSTTYPDAACDLLVLAAVDDHAGSLARNAYRRWAKQEAATLTDDFKVALTRACQRLAEAYPASMLSRIAELATSTDHDDKTSQTNPVTQAVSEALNTLWDNSAQRPDIQNQLTAWTRATQPSPRAAAQSTFAHLAQRRTPSGPALLTDPAADTAWLTNMWRNALPTAGWSPAVADAFAHWMQTAIAHPELRETTEQIMCDAVHRTNDPHYSANRLIAMQNLLYSWAPAPPAPQHTAATHLRDQILTRLRAQDPAAPPTTGTHAPQP